MKTLLLVAAFILALVLPGASFAQEDVWTKGYLFGTDKEVWFGPGGKVSNSGPLERQINSMLGGAHTINTTAATGGLNVAETGAVALRDGRLAAVTATRFASTANVFKAVKALATGPLGVTLLLMEAVPAILDWMSGSGNHVRSDPAGSGLQVNNSLACSSAPCFQYAGSYGGWLNSLQASCDAALAHYLALYPSWSSRLTNRVTSSINLCEVLLDGGAFYNEVDATRSVAPVEPTWMPASMDDIAPYMTTRVPPPALLAQIAAAGVPVDVTPVSVTVAPLTPLAPLVKTTTYPKPPDRSSSSIAAGNPFGLVDNTPTVTSSGVHPGPVPAGSTSSTGSTASGQGVSSSPVPVSTPVTTTATSTFNPTTNQTTTNTTVSQDGATAVTTTTATTNVSNTTNSSTVNNTYNTTTNITNLTTGAAIGAPVVDTSTPPAPAPDAKTDCDKFPSHIGCSDYGTPPLAEAIPKTSVPVTWTNVTFSGAGSCPAPFIGSVNVGTFVKAWSISFDPMCSLMTTLAPLFLALGAAAAAWVFMEGLHT